MSPWEASIGLFLLGLLLVAIVETLRLATGLKVSRAIQLLAWVLGLLGTAPLLCRMVMVAYS